MDSVVRTDSSVTFLGHTVSRVASTTVQFGGSVGVAVLATVAATTMAHHSASAQLMIAAGYTHAFWICAVIIAVAIPIVPVLR